MTLKHLFFSLCLGLLCCVALPAFSQDSDNDDVPTSPPPVRPGGANGESVSNTRAAVSLSLDAIELVFLKNADNARIEVYSSDGVCVYQTQGSAEAYDRLKIEANSWRGRYTLYLTVEGDTQAYPLNL